MKSNIKSYQDLEVWQKPMGLVVICYQMTMKFPKIEIYGLSSQLRRAAVSVPANIAEGLQRQHSKEFLQHLSISYGSLAELETRIQIAGRLNDVYEDQINTMLDITSEIGKMLNGLRRSIKKRS